MAFHQSDDGVKKRKNAGGDVFHFCAPAYADSRARGSHASVRAALQWNEYNPSPVQAVSGQTL